LSKTYIPLPKWMLAIYLFCSSGDKVKASELARTLELPNKTAWQMLKKIQKESKNFEFEKLAGIV
jgi:Mn-dependent DtxR family transcriptional regulator